MTTRGNKRDIFDAWAPAAARWSQWVKPVLFAAMNERQVDGDRLAPSGGDLDWVRRADRETLYVLDLPGAEGVALALDMARHGFRPVPLYNALPGPLAGRTPATKPVFTAVSVAPIVEALRGAADALRDIELAPTAAPAFLLDWNRNSNAVRGTPNYFDNRSISFPSDFPSADQLLSNGITRAVLVQRGTSSVHADLSQSLAEWQEHGLRLELKRIDLPGGPLEIRVKRPSRMRKLWLQVKAYLLKSETGFGVSVSRGGGG